MKKNIFIIILVLLLVLAMLGSFASLGSSSGGAGGEETTVTTQRIEVSDTPPEDVTELLATYTEGVSDPEGAIQMGHISSAADDFTMIGLSFKNLTVGETYTVSFALHVYLMQYLKPDCFWLRTGGANGALTEVAIGTSDYTYFNGSFSFVAETTSAEFLIQKVSYTNDSDVISSYGIYINQYSIINLYKGGDTA